MRTRAAERKDRQVESIASRVGGYMHRLDREVHDSGVDAYVRKLDQEGKRIASEAQRSAREEIAMPKSQVQAPPERPNLRLLFDEWRDMVRAEDTEAAERMEGRIRSLAASNRYHRSDAQHVLDSLNASIQSNREFQRIANRDRRLKAAFDKFHSSEYKLAKSESEKVTSLRRLNKFKIDTAKLSGKRVVKQFAIPELETVKADTLIQQAFGGTTVLSDESQDGLSGFCGELVDHLGPKKALEILAGIKEETGRNAVQRTGYIAKREFPLYLDAFDSELRQFGKSLVEVYGNKSKGIGKVIEKNLLLEQRRDEYLEDTALE